MPDSVGTTYLTENIVAIRVIGPIDARAAARLEHTLASLLESNCYDIVFDLGDVDYVCSTGWSLFVDNLKEIRDRGGDLKLARMNENVYETYKEQDLFWFLRSYLSLEEAVYAFENAITPIPE
jgi:anti-sigma B factor antagonist